MLLGFFILIIFALDMASADIYERKDVYGREKEGAEGSAKIEGATKVKSPAETKTSAETVRSGISPDKSSADVSEFVSPGKSEVPTDGGFNKGMFDGILDDVKGGGMGSGLTGAAGMAPMGGGGSGGNSGDSGVNAFPDVNKLPAPAPEPQPYPNKGGGLGKKRKDAPAKDLQIKQNEETNLKDSPGEENTTQSISDTSISGTQDIIQR